MRSGSRSVTVESQSSRVVVEHVLGLAGLKVEEAEYERSRQAEQR